MPSPSGNKLLYYSSDSKAEGLGISQLGVVDLEKGTFIAFDREGYGNLYEEGIGWSNDSTVSINARSSTIPLFIIHGLLAYRKSQFLTYRFFPRKTDKRPGKAYIHLLHGCGEHRTRLCFSGKAGIGGSTGGTVTGILLSLPHF